MDTNKMYEILKENESRTREDLFWDAYECGYYEAMKDVKNKIEVCGILLEKKINKVSKETVDFLDEILRNDYEE